MLNMQSNQRLFGGEGAPSTSRISMQKPQKACRWCHGGRRLSGDPTISISYAGLRLTVSRRVLSDERLFDMIAFPFASHPFPNAVFLGRLPYPTASASYNEIARTIIRHRLHALDDRVMNLCICRDISRFTHGKWPFIALVSRLAKNEKSTDQRMASQLPSFCRSILRKGRYSIKRQKNTLRHGSPFRVSRQSWIMPVL